MQDVTSNRDVEADRLHDNWRVTPDKILLNTGGVYVCDYNRDGWLDLLLTDVSLPRGVLFYQGGEDKFVDVTAHLGLRANGRMLPAIADLDNDGWEDIILGPNAIFRNVKGQRFAELRSTCNLWQFCGDNERSDASGIALLDYDRDGLIDIYVFRSSSASQNGSWLDGQVGDDYENQLLRNLGDWKFDDVTISTGSDGGKRSTLAAVCFDANNDAWPDVYVIDEHGAGVLLLNQAGEHFEARALAPNDAATGARGATAGDYDNDGYEDLYVAGLYSTAGARIIGNLKPDSYEPRVMAKLERMVAGSQLHQNRGHEWFEQQNEDLAQIGWAHGPAMIDLDNDGWLDLFATTGLATHSAERPDTAPCFWQIVAAQPFDRSCQMPPPSTLVTDPPLFWSTQPQKLATQGNLGAFQRNRALLNLRGEGFLDVSYVTGTDSQGDGRSAVAADFNNDGRQDLIVRQVSGGAVHLYENQFPQQHWLKVSLRGTNSNRLGIGSRLAAEVGGQRLYRQLNPQNSYQSQTPCVVHFGLSAATQCELLGISWPSGARQLLTDVPADQHIVVTEGRDGFETVTPGETFAP